ncbi:hypothetical protein [Polaribacter sp. R77954]|uniref:hypothetical protein n=1 Tax=Polaribacter sp. R77954 TaxID=3093870 RepID=UPI0037C78A2D
MSGPKSFNPPERYSIDTFNGSLNDAFQLQTQIKAQIEKIESLLINDTSLDVNLDCQEDLSKIKKDLNALLEPLIFNYEVNFNQQTFDVISAEIIQRITDLHAQKNKLDTIELDFNEKKLDYDQYLSYLKYNEQSEISFNDFKKKISDYYKNAIAADKNGVFENTILEIDNIKYTKKSDDFSFGFNAIYEAKKAEIVAYTKNKEAQINNARTKASNKIINLSDGISLKDEKEKIAEEVKNWQEKITSLIDNCNDAASKISYRDKLENLLESKVLKEEYYFKELFDSILLNEKRNTNKKIVFKLLSTLNSEPFHNSLLDKKQVLGKRLSALLNHNNIKDTDVVNMKRELKILQKQSNKRVKEEGVLERERLFLKSQVVSTLSNMGYEVMDDLKVIDFEKSNDYLLKVKGQENYMNLIFREDGSMRYNFQIPENKKELSVDEKNLKLQEMKMSCDDFNIVINDLRKMGLKLNVNSKQPISEASLMQFTKKTKERLKGKQEKSTNKQKQVALKKKYLD